MEGLGKGKGKQKGPRQSQVPSPFTVHAVCILFYVYLLTQVHAIRIART